MEIKIKLTNSSKKIIDLYLTGNLYYDSRYQNSNLIWFRPETNVENIEIWTIDFQHEGSVQYLNEDSKYLGDTVSRIVIKDLKSNSAYYIENCLDEDLFDDLLDIAIDFANLENFSDLDELEQIVDEYTISTRLLYKEAVIMESRDVDYSVDNTNIVDTTIDQEFSDSVNLSLSVTKNTIDAYNLVVPSVNGVNLYDNNGLWNINALYPTEYEDILDYMTDMYSYSFDNETYSTQTNLSEYIVTSWKYGIYATSRIYSSLVLWNIKYTNNKIIMALEYSDFYYYDPVSNTLFYDYINSTIKLSDIVVSAAFSEPIYSIEINDLTMKGSSFDSFLFQTGQTAVGIALGLAFKPYIWVPYSILTWGINSIDNENYYYSDENYRSNYPKIFEDISAYQNDNIDLTQLFSISQEIDPSLFMQIFLSYDTLIDYERHSGFEFVFGFYNDSDIVGLPYDGEYFWKYKIEFSIRNGFLGKIVDPYTGNTTGDVKLNQDFAKIRYGSNITSSC
ncbi:MAG: hypothetical protein WCR19_03310 [Acholeplasmataceae bacterium]